MEDKDKLIDQSELASSVAEKIPYEYTDSFLVKLLDPIKVKKEFKVPVPKDEKPKKDENGIEAVDFEETRTEIKEVDSDYRKGVVLKVPYIDTMHQIKVGDVIVFRDATTRFFDLLKDSFYAWALGNGGVTDWAWHDEALDLFIQNHLALITTFHQDYNEDENEEVSFDDFTTWLAEKKIEEKLKGQENSHG